MRRKSLGLLVAVTLLASPVLAGASMSTGASPAPGVTKGAIKLGITYVDLETLREEGIVDIDHGDYETAFRTVIDDINAKSGVGNREIEAVFAPINPIGTVPAQEACVKLSEDEEVFAVIGFFLDDAPICYLEGHDTPVLGGNMTAELLARANAPWFTLEPGDAQAAQGIDALAEDGVFKRGKVGVVTMASQEALLNDVVLPAFERNKVEVISAINDAPPGDVPAGEQENDAILARFEAERIKTVVAVDNAVLGVGQGLERSGYRPRLVGTNVNTFLAYIVNPGTDHSVLTRAISAGTALDFDEPDMQQCYRMVEKATGDKIVENRPIVEGEPDYRTSAEAACRYMALFTAIAEAAGKKLTVESFGRAGEKLREVEIPGSGVIEYDPKTHSYDLPTFLFRYDPDVSNLVQDDEPV